MPFSVLLDEISIKVATVIRLVALSSILEVDLREVLYEVDQTTTIQPRVDLEKHALRLLREWVYSGGTRVELLRALQSRHINGAAETISSGKNNVAIQGEYNIAGQFDIIPYLFKQIMIKQDRSEYLIVPEFII